MRSEKHIQIVLKAVDNLSPEEKSIFTDALRGIQPTVDDVIMIMRRLSAVRTLYCKKEE